MKVHEVYQPANVADRWPRGTRVIVLLLLDLTALTAALFLAYALRFNFEIRPDTYEYFWQQLPLVVGFQMVCLWMAGARAASWRYISLAELPLFLLAALLWSLPLLALRFLLDVSVQFLRLPLSVIVIDTLLAFLGVLGVRVVRRAMLERSDIRKRRGTSSGEQRRPVLFVGAGRAGVLSAREVRARGDSDLEPIGFVDDDPLKVGSVIQGIPVLGTTADLPRLVARHRPDHVVLTIADAEPARLRRIVEICEQIPIKVRTIPAFHDLLQGRVSIQRFRDVEPAELLGRAAVEADSEQLRDFLTGKRVMVTGAGGSIGSELARQIAVFRPSRLILIDRSEFALFQINRELGEAWPEIAIAACLGDVCDERRMRQLLRRHEPHIVVHAAAHKHVTMLETQPAEAVTNNVFASELLGELCGEYRAEAFVLVSTDKAVRPTSVMGASKRVAELVIQALDQRHATRFMAVRFGNVLGSTGSVVPIFAEQIKRGGPVTVTHPDMMRYFMSIPEASQLVLSAAAMGQGGEVFVLDMGAPLSIVELAEKMIRLSGFEPYDDIDIVFTGPNPGEKLAEQLAHTAEELQPTRNPKIFVGAIPVDDPERVRSGLERLHELVTVGDEAGLRRFLNQLLPEARLAPAESNPR
jgi:FlaA1/EpsC-like NDP-sugar epimerase